MMSLSMMSPERTPVLIGVGQVNDRASEHDSLGLMVQALQAADTDAGGRWIKRLDSIAIVNQISFPALGNCAEKLAAHFEITPAHVEQTPYPTGESPIQLLHDAANRIGAGEITTAFVGGAEALRTAARRIAEQGESKRDALRERARPNHPSYAMRYGLVAPTDIYPLYENATRAAWGQSLDEAQAESATLWAGMSRIAAANPQAWLQQECSAEEVAERSADNRPIAYPYVKRMVANASVNQGAGFIVTSLAEARSRGVAEERIIYVGMGAAAHEATNILERDSLSDPKAMRVTIEETLRRNAMTVDDIDHAELYSCFPCIPKMARRILDWPLEKPITAFGGLTFGGGPIGNYMSHALASMIDRLRADGGRALLFANGGFATHFHGIVLSAKPLPDAQFPHDYDCNDQAAALRDVVPPVDENYAGEAKIESFTVFFKRDGQVDKGVVAARTSAGARCLAHVPGEDAAALDILMEPTAEPVGMAGQVTPNEDGLSRWQFLPASPLAG